MAQPVILTVNPSDIDPAAIKDAADRIRRGGLVAFPTETVYGLAAAANNPKAIERLNRVKGRPPEKPYSLHLYSVAQVREFVDAVPPIAQRLMDKFWPGPLTIVMPARTGSLGFRLPQHAVAQAFLQACGTPVVAPSANRSGSPPPTDSPEVLAALGEACECLLDAGPTPLGRESTVVSVVGGRLQILREGAISAAALEAA
ncbi:MAG: threonylcarbamoyl-AMP synthase [Candidatus Omnitrophica bacterium]|nr:threonylcarbamoyl-AMP synthase [Candidatus Omnitrophota bacterium]